MKPTILNFSRRILVALALTGSLVLFPHCTGNEMMRPDGADVCDDSFNQVLPVGTSEADCNASSRGEWLDGEGVCYCFGQGEG